MTMTITKGRIISIRSSFLSECKNVQKSVLKSVTVQTSAKSIFQFFAFSFFEGSHICRFLPILRPSSVPPSHYRTHKEKHCSVYQRFIFADSTFCVGKQRMLIRSHILNVRQETIKVTKPLIFRNLRGLHSMYVLRLKYSSNYAITIDNLSVTPSALESRT